MRCAVVFVLGMIAGAMCMIAWALRRAEKERREDKRDE